MLARAARGLEQASALGVSDVDSHHAAPLQAWNKVARERHDHVGRRLVFLSRYIGDPENTPFAERPAAMFPQLCPPVPPFQSTYPKVWFMQLDAVLALNGVTEQPLMHAILHDALPVELRHLSATSTSSQQPYDDLCSAVLASYGLTYHPLPFTRDFQVFPASQRAGPSGPKLSSDRNPTSPTTSPSTFGPATSAVVLAPGHRSDEVLEVVPAADNLSTRKCVFSKSSADGPSGTLATCTFSTKATARDTVAPPDSMTTTLPPTSESGTGDLSPVIDFPTSKLSPSTTSDKRDLTSRLANSDACHAPDCLSAKVLDIWAEANQSATRFVFSSSSADDTASMPTTGSSRPTSMAHNMADTSGSTTATSPNALVTTTTMGIITPAIHLPVAKPSPSQMSKGDCRPASTLCTSCQQRPPSSSQFPAAEVKATSHQPRPSFQDAATMTDALEDDVPGPLQTGLTRHTTPVVEQSRGCWLEEAINYADLHANPRARTTGGHYTSTGVPSNTPGEPTLTGFHHHHSPEPLPPDGNNQTCVHKASSCVTTAMTLIPHTCLPPITLRRRRQRARRRTLRQLLSRPATQPRVTVTALKTAQAPTRPIRRNVPPLVVYPTTHRTLGGIVRTRSCVRRHVRRRSTLRSVLRLPQRQNPHCRLSADVSSMTSRHTVHSRPVRPGHPETRLSATTATRHFLLRPLRFSQSHPPETYCLPMAYKR
ncbi:uncharacterized protein LOC119175854 isoform X1 [Rhipicephalus microplus]|uniref:uncharacterized protein LOC119175854 isoform X1 n=1 Tax=Rhipicephalus microplus TaxID=6941 RepID=UPI003F6D7093